MHRIIYRITNEVEDFFQALHPIQRPLCEIRLCYNDKCYHYDLDKTVRGDTQFFLLTLLFWCGF
jgi:hypothetical protein